MQYTYQVPGCFIIPVISTSEYQLQCFSAIVTFQNKTYNCYFSDHPPFFVLYFVINKINKENITDEGSNQQRALQAIESVDNFVDYKARKW